MHKKQETSMKSGIELAISRAIEGGYDFEGKLKNVGLGNGVWELNKPDEIVVRRKEVLIDYEEIVKYYFPISMVRENPLFWQCLGKALGWWHCTVHVDGGEEVRCEDRKHDDWFKNWHRFIDSLAEGKSPEEFFNQLIHEK